MSGDLSFLYSAIEELVIVSQSNLFNLHNASELLFEGYQSDVLDFGNSFGGSPGDGNDADEQVKIDKFGWFYIKNGTSTDGTYQVHTGANDINKLGMMSQWKYKDELTQWRDECNRLNDSFPGEFQPPFVPRSNRLKLFIGDLCRPLILTYQKDIEFKGLKLKRYILGPDNFNYDLPENQCYCSPKKGYAN